VAGGGTEFPSGEEVEFAEVIGEWADVGGDAGGFGGIEEARHIGHDAADGGIAGGIAVSGVEVREFEGVGVDGGIGPVLEEFRQAAGVVEVAVGEEDGAGAGGAEEFGGGIEDAVGVAFGAGVDKDEFVGVDGDEVGVGDAGGEAVDVWGDLLGGGGHASGGVEFRHDSSSSKGGPAKEP
jgi:hypothetical protein